MSSIFLGAYWGSRQESREVISRKISAFMIGLGRIDGELERWFNLGNSRKKANTEIDLSENSVYGLS